MRFDKEKIALLKEYLKKTYLYPFFCLCNWQILTSLTPQTPPPGVLGGGVSLTNPDIFNTTFGGVKDVTKVISFAKEAMLQICPSGLVKQSAVTDLS